MPAYTAPVSDMMFLLREVLDAPAVFGAAPDLAEIDMDLVESVLHEAGRFCSDVIYPLNLSGDREGCRLEEGVVHTPKGFAQAYKTFAEAGWGGLSAPAEFGGQALPRTVQIMVDEMLSAANLSFGLFPGLTRGACETIEAHASDALKALYLPKMIAGTWSGAMALTEGGAGSDLGLLKASATPRGDGSYSVSGSKIFISSGEHEMAENIIHLVLARLPDAPAGTRGISLFLCPKYIPDAAGNPGERNTLSVGALEHKMGIHAQPTCVMNYDGCQGWLVGEPHRGLAAMFTMMNAERLFVGMQGLGVADASYQNAAIYAKERLQGRDATGTGPVPIIAHPDVRRMLMQMRAFIEGARALALFTALEMDKEKHHPDAAVRAEATGLVALLTPVIKAALTDFGFETAVLGQQVLGGHGYISEWGQEQYVRDARIAMIYEGTNGIQAQDLVVRKIGLEGGKVLAGYLAQIRASLAAAQGVADLGALPTALAEALEALEKASARLVGGDLAATDERNGAAVDYLRLFALVSFGWFWLRMALAVKARGTVGADGEAKLMLARFFAERMLPQSVALARQIDAGAGAMMALPVDAF